LRAGKINRFDFLRGAAGLGLTAAAAVSVLDPASAVRVLAAANPNATPAHPPMKSKYLIGFSQSELTNAWRTTESSSMAAEAKKRSAKYSYIATVANSDTNKQVSDVEDMISKKCDLIVITPRQIDPLKAATAKALAAGIPVIEIDRDTAEKPGVNYICAIESNFVQQGQKVANYLVANTSGPINYVELRGSTGASPAIDRGHGWHSVIDKVSRFHMLDSQDGDFVQATGKKVMTNWITKFGTKIDLVYAHNDAMAVGALQAVREAGFSKKLMFGSIDGQKNAIQYVAQGVFTVVVQSDPHFGPVTFDTIDMYFAGKAIPGHITVKDHTYTKANAAALVNTGF
jgi:ribose transport system substrate-binding protein